MLFVFTVIFIIRYKIALHSILFNVNFWCYSLKIGELLDAKGLLLLLFDQFRKEMFLFSINIGDNKIL